MTSLGTCKGDYVEATMTSESLLKMTKVTLGCFFSSSVVLSVLLFQEIYGGHHVRLAESLHNYGLTMFVTEQVRERIFDVFDKWWWLITFFVFFFF